MPIDEATGALRDFTFAEIEAMEIECFVGRGGEHGSETRELDQNTMTKMFFCKWSQRFNFCELVLGNELIYDDSGTTKLSRCLPDDVYGRHDLYPELVATRIEKIEGVAPGIDEEGDGVVSYEKAMVRVFYEHVPYDLYSDQYLVDNDLTEKDRYVYFLESSGTVETYAMPGGSMQYLVSGGTDVGTPEPHKRRVQTNVVWNRPVEELTLVWERVPAEIYAPSEGVLFKKIYGTEDGEEENSSWIGKMNRQMFFGRLPGTVMLLGCRAQPLRAQTAVGRRYRFFFSLAYAPSGWDRLRYFPPAGDSGAGTYFVGRGDTIYTPNGLPDNYSIVDGARDLNNLFSLTG